MDDRQVCYLDDGVYSPDARGADDIPGTIRLG